MNPLTAELAEGSIVMLAPKERKMIDIEGYLMLMPYVGVKLSYLREGVVRINSGRLVAGDPCSESISRSLRITVPPGEYEAWSVLAHSQNESVVAFAVLKITDQPVHSYSVAVFDDEDPSEVDEDSIGGTGTDSAVIAIGDAIPEGTSLDPEEVPELNDFQRACWEVERWKLLNYPGAGALALWQCGTGDGNYTSYWGLDARKKPCTLVVDFDVIENGLRGPAVKSDSVGQSLKRYRGEKHRPGRR